MAYEAYQDENELVLVGARDAARKISAILSVLTAAARGGNMTDERAEEIYTEFIECYNLMNEDFPKVLLTDIQRIIIL